ncbi:NAD(P)/FAD-dependent oxidoreductase [Jeotgalibacillus sp. R-1-5s-1]|uniref:phytoene desaturase family protein n=1 Tax=Jeotgalibacillus sp. R-1-5s-1 TaxID=2555897 RepID=UPI00141BC0DB
MKAVIVGAGLGGLAAGVRLQNAGYDVTIVEKNDHVGGKMMPVKIGDYSFDFGPNTITMPWVFESVLDPTEFDLSDYLNFIKLERHTLNVFPDGSQLLQSVHPDEMINQFKKLDPPAAQKYWDYLKEVSRLYKQSENGFFNRTFSSWRDYLSPGLTSAFLSVRPFEKLDHFHRRYFSNPDVLKVFNRYATYIGSSPFKSPATFGMIGHLEMSTGVFTVKGGNPKIAEAYADVFRKTGGTILLNTEAEEILMNGNKAGSVKLHSGHLLKADEVIINGDFVTATKKLIPQKYRRSLPDSTLDGYEPSISAFVILAGLKERNESIHHHHVFFPEDYEKEFHDIFKENKLPEDPTIYISHSAATDSDVSKGSNLFILVNAPATKVKNPEQYKNKIYDMLERKGVPIREQLEVEKIFTPDDLADKFYAYKGSIYGISSHSMKDSFLRPRNKSRDIENLYYTGGTTHPGGGSPMVVLSGINVSNMILKKNVKK